MFGGKPSNNSLGVGNNYSMAPGYTQMPRNNYSSMNQGNMMIPPNPMQNLQLQSINNVLQVMGPESAQAFQIGPDSKVILMDAKRPIFYGKQSDSSGGYSETKAYKFKEIPFNELIETPVQSQEDNSNPDYITKAEFSEFKKMIEDLVMKDE